MTTDNVTPIRASVESSTSTGAPPAKPQQKKRRRCLNRTELGQRIEAERSRLFRAMGIVSVVGRTLHDLESADVTTLQNVMYDGWCALKAAYEVMDGVAGAMEAGVFLGDEDARS